MDREVVSLLNYLLKRWQPPIYQQALSEISFPFYLIKKNPVLTGIHLQWLIYAGLVHMLQYMYKGVHIYIHIGIYTYIHTRIYVYTHIHTHIFMYICSMYVYSMHVCIFMFTYMYVVCKYKYTAINIHM